MNFCAIGGELTENVEVRTTTNSQVANLRIKVTRTRNDRTFTSYRTAVFWGDLCEQVRSLRGGAYLVVSGSREDRKNTTRDGGEKGGTEIRARDVDVISEIPLPDKTANPLGLGPEDDLPF